ncbi:hypothetical protein FVR03_22775 [Pontibacter qinzhouensis]|uniref:Uncharacterized protein n=1 Tax=Pontibacter qinzhouensis TaxID=2603253 RepID=A0A5C8IQL4_9BACT|nr:hypothetical protein [Pontibacter qinzhouensis]TXK23326.1 hypothetical protein FVR03_22775 [Pontibacter qinzhouensis]
MKQTKIDTRITRLGEDIPVTGVSIGGILDGTTLSKDESVVSILKKIFTKESTPSYTAPARTFSSSITGNVEAGTLIRPALSATFTKNDAGDLTRYLLRRGNTTLLDQATISSFTDSYSIGDETVEYQATFYYADGPVKNTNLGNPYPTGQIKAGSISSNTVSIVGRRNLFYDTSKTGLNTSANIRSFVNKSLNPGAGTTFTINIPAGATSVQFSYPASIRDVNSVKYVEGLNAEVKDIFTKTVVSVEGANGFTPINYKVYNYVPTAPFGSAAKYSITI